MTKALIYPQTLQFHSARIQKAKHGQVGTVLAGCPVAEEEDLHTQPKEKANENGKEVWYPHHLEQGAHSPPHFRVKSQDVQEVKLEYKQAYRLQKLTESLSLPEPSFLRVRNKISFWKKLGAPN